MATSSLRRQVKNIVHNYSDAEVKVREATSNDPWGPSATLMSEIAQMTQDPQIFPEVMMMVWRRLNDSGKNWRHVYKGLTLLDYLIKNGSNKVIQDSKENVMAVKTLKDFQFFDRDGRDQGINVREKAKTIVALLNDEERLKQERTQAQTTRRRLSQVTAAIDSRHRIRYNEGSECSPASKEIEQARPQSSGEEELQLQLALAMSREEAEKKQEPSAPDPEEELQLQAALTQSKEEYEREMKSHQGAITIIEKALLETQLSNEREEQKIEQKKKETHMSDLIDIFGPPPSSTSSTTWDSQYGSYFPSSAATSLFAAWGPANQTSNPNVSSLPWDAPHSTQLRADNTQSQSIIFSCDSLPGWSEPQSLSRSLPSDPWGDRMKDRNESIYEIFTPPSSIKDVQSPSSIRTENTFGPNEGMFDMCAPLSSTNEAQSPSSIKTDNSFELDFFGESEHASSPATETPDPKSEDLNFDSKVRSNTPELFLEPAARTLVNLDSLVSYSSTMKTKNPFVSGISAPSANNPFQHGDLRPSLNQMRAASPAPNTTAAPLSMSTPCLIPTNPMEAGMNSLRTLPPMPGFPVPSGVPVPLQPFVPYPMGYPYVPLPVTLPQQIAPAPSSTQAGTNPFL